jgi:hypothetical protein
MITITNYYSFYICLKPYRPYSVKFSMSNLLKAKDRQNIVNWEVENVENLKVT